jgi:hypothetical protein
MKKLNLLVLLSLLIVPVQGAMQSSVTQDGITWTFDKEYEVGQFVNDEWWVKGPITLNAITPGAATDGGLDINGSMLNPVTQNQHGLDGRGKVGGTYVAGLNIAKQLPIRISPGSSVLSAISRIPYGKPALREAAVLTVLEQVPSAKSFRPPYYGTEKPLYHKSQLHYDVFQNLARVAGAPVSLNDLTNGSCKKVLIGLNGRGGAQKDTELKTQAAPDYGRKISAVHGAAALALNLAFSDAEKEPLLIELVQRGLDVYGGIKAGFGWFADGGHRMGYKLPLYIAGKALQAQEILHYVNTDAYKDEEHFGGGDRIADYDRFQEGQQHYYMTNGTPEWAAQAWTKKGEPVIEWGNGYRQMNSSRNTTNVLVLTLMGARALWNHEAMFEYIIDRYWPAELAGKNASGTNGIGLFTKAMWLTYFGKVDPLVTAVLEPVYPPEGTPSSIESGLLYSIDGRLLPDSYCPKPGIYIMTTPDQEAKPVLLWR